MLSTRATRALPRANIGLPRRWKILDASLSVEDLGVEVERVALETIRACAARPVGTLSFGDITFPERG